MSVQTVTEAEARAIMRTQGWTYKQRSRYGLKTKYVYAQRRQGPKMLDRYICPLSRLGNLTEQELLAKLTLPPEAAEHT